MSSPIRAVGPKGVWDGNAIFFFANSEMAVFNQDTLRFDCNLLTRW